jgi:hypothetical protein
MGANGKSSPGEDDVVTLSLPLNISFVPAVCRRSG